jgi:hypothetical protein
MVFITRLVFAVLCASFANTIATPVLSNDLVPRDPGTIAAPGDVEGRGCWGEGGSPGGNKYGGGSGGGKGRRQKQAKFPAMNNNNDKPGNKNLQSNACGGGSSLCCLADGNGTDACLTSVDGC